jgi:hypothetical protein
MRTLKLALAAVAAFAFNANAAPVIGMGNPPTATYQPTTPTDLTGQIIGGPTDPAVFHAGGVAACDGCHVMHNAAGGNAKSTTGSGQSVNPWTNVTNAYLLQGSDQSSTCLICHGASGASGVQFTVADTGALGSGATATAPANMTPGGDFGWTNIDFANSPSKSHGHNVVAQDFPSFASDNQTLAPGGTYQGGPGIKAFGCHSCHDPHGRYRMIDDGSGNVTFAGPNSNFPIVASGSYNTSPNPTATLAVGAYRILGGFGYAPASNPSAPFPNDPPIAVAPVTYNQNEGTAGEVRVAYGKGMSEWCQNCHTNIHLAGYTTGVAGLRHPAGSTAFLHAGQYDIYNKYISTGNMGGGADQYTSLVPFEQTGKTFAQLKGDMTNVVADGTSAVMCLSCHRAHASAFDFMVRWDQNATFLTDSNSYTPGLTDRDDTVTQAGYYGRSVGGAENQIGPYQRSLCNKCHGKD